MKKLIAFQKEIKPIIKDSDNPFYKSKYVDINGILNDIRPILNKLGLILVQPLTQINGKPAIQTMLIDSEDGACLVDSIIPLIEIQDPQKFGACITYFRRYAIQSLLCLEAEDDDGNTASGKTVGYSTEAKSTYQPTPRYNQPAYTSTIGRTVKVIGQKCNDCKDGVYIKSKAGNIVCNKACWAKKEPEVPVVDVNDDINMPEIPFG